MAKKHASKTANKADYAVSKATPDKRVKAPLLPYKPSRAKAYRPRIGIIGCGGIISTHLDAYKQAGYKVVAFQNRTRSKAEQVRDDYYPRATVFDTVEELLANPDIAIVDIATHPAERVPIIAAAINAGKHVLSQKPFVEDIAIGKKLVTAARRKGLQLAVNQNGRWAAHVAYAREAIQAGLLGEVMSVDLAVHWDHNWCAGTPFDRIPQLVLYDFGVHWFDMVQCYLGAEKAKSVFATVCKSRSQLAKPPFLESAVVEYKHAQASIILRADTRFGAQDRSVIVGSEGTLVCEGPNLNEQQVTLYTQQGIATPKLTTQWFPDGFDGTMSELICAIEAEREPSNSARENLRSLELCFSALRSAELGTPVKVGDVSSL